ncbi:Ig-like domain repeat protein [uncultured Methanobrevibacter sp.]|uniref:Ig-like domain repeat protein n=1 Tax=uncultured Methanobrevibacter sp. TaxID=253161 RepID=UPI0025D90D67|nr:Ig-like domain repeat protein [uncultured Methanobrevibacter sp.]
MKYKQVMLLVCMITCMLFTFSCVFANDAMNETISQNDLEAQELPAISSDVNNTNVIASNPSSASNVYFDASASNDGDGSKSNPYKYYKSDRINYGDTVYFADGVYDITEPESIYSSSTYKTTFIGQSVEKTILRSNLEKQYSNKFDFTVTDNSYLVLNKLTMIGVHINNQANLIANNVMFKNSEGFNSNNNPTLSYSHISKIYDSTGGGVIICDTPFNRVTTLNLTDCYFNGNSASSGGVIATYNSIANIQNCVFYNSSAKRFGGAIYSICSKLNIYDSSFDINDAKYGGAIYANETTVNIKNSQFTNSQAFSFGGVIASFSSQLDLNHAVFDGYASLNDAGGAIYVIRGTFKAVYSSFKNGYSEFGGAICNLKTVSTISNSEFTNNHATHYGGSIYNMYGSMVLTGNVFNSTHADSGGSIFNRLTDSFILSNNRFTDSTANEGQIVYVDGKKVKVVQSGNIYDSSYDLLKYGNIYDIDHYNSVPLIQYVSEPIDSLPSSYDARKYGYVTPAKDQIQGGNCWAFSGIATLESCLKKATGIDYDFSEENVKNLMYEFSLFDSDTGITTGGNLYMFIAYLAGWFGPTFDANDVYDDHSALSVIYDSLVHVQNVYILPERQTFYDNDNIKLAILEYGAVSIGIDLPEGQGHAVSIVGWDDEFTANDFLGNKAVGAWIIKNSWGSDWGYDGFGYLSYQQPIRFGYTFIFNDDNVYNNIYQYDYAGKSGLHTINGEVLYIKNKFTARNDEILSAFSTYFDEPTNFTASVYLNGNLMTTQSGYSKMGYYTIPLKKEVSLKKGDTFEILVKIFNGSPVYIPICDASDEINKMNFDKGISFYSIDGVHWNDLYESSSPSVACIKAFTRLKELTQVSIDLDQSGSGDSNPFGNINVDDLVNINLNLPEYFVEDGIQYPLEGLVTFKINGKDYFATVHNGKACLNITFEKEGTYDINAQFKSSRITSNIVNFKANVVKTAQSNLVIQANDVSKFYGGPEKYVATLSNGVNALNGVNVKILLNGREYGTYKTNNNGQVVLDLQLPAGSYVLSARYGGKSAVSEFNILPTIGVNNLTRDVLNSSISASFLNTDGNVLSNRKVSFSVGIYGENSIPLQYDATTDKLGLATANVNLYAGKYLVTVVNPINNEKKEFTLDISKIDSVCSLSVYQISSTVIINATVGPSLTSGYVDFIVLGKIYKVKLNPTYIDGNRVSVASLNLKNLAVGSYEVSAVFSGDDNLRVSSDKRSFSVTNNPCRIYSYNYWCYYGGSGTIAQITDANGNPVKGQVVSATILNKTYKSTTDADGNAIFNLDLEVGNYSVLFEYKGQSLKKHLFVYSTIENVTTRAEYLNSNIGAYFMSPYEDEDNNNLDVKFIINGNEYAATTDSNGYASVKADLPVGTHTITIVNLCSGEKKQSEISIYKTTPVLILKKTKRGDSVFISASLTQSSAVGNVVFTIGSKKYTAAIIDGKAVLELNALEEGSYEVYANYIGDYNFNNIVSSTLKFDYEHTNYTISVPSVSKYYGGSEKFTVTLKNFNKPVINALVTLTIGDKEYNIKTDSNGVATFGENLNPGVYSVLCNYDDNIDLSEITVKSTVNLLDVADGSYSKISVEFTDANGNLLKNSPVKFKVGSKEYAQTTNNFGVAAFDANLDLGNYTVAIINPTTGETKYAPLEVTGTTPTLILFAVKENCFDVLKAILPKTATGDVEFELDNGITYFVEVNEGVSRLEGIDPGEYTVTATYKGDNHYKPVTKSVKFKVSLSSSMLCALTASKVTTTYGTSKNIAVTLKDSKGNPLVGREVTVTLNKKVYTAEIPSDGVAKIHIPSNLAAKTYNDVTVSFAGETGILAKTIQTEVVVKKATPKMTASKKTFKVKDKNKYYQVTLKTDKKKAYKKQKITIKVKGKTYSAKTNSKGVAKFKLTKLTKKGTFKATVKYSGSPNFKAVSKTVKITVK